MSLFDSARDNLRQIQPVKLEGRVTEVRGLMICVEGLSAPVGSAVTVHADRGVRKGEIVAFDADQALVMLLGDTLGISRGDAVVADGVGSLARVGGKLLGRVIDAMGRPLDGKGPIREGIWRPLRPRPIDPLTRVPIREALSTGIRTIDSMLTAGRGQRLGIFSGPGVGKSTLMGMIARQTDADVSVIALVGERGREVQDFIQNVLGEEGLARSVVVVATADEPALLRLRAALLATTVAEYFRDEGSDVVLLMDSITRFCQSQRQVGLAAGEPPATKGYTPSVFAELPALLERSGRTGRGSITGFYTVLVEGDDLSEPVSDAARAILDGHIVLRRNMAQRGHWPAIDVLESISRLAIDVIDADHQNARIQVMRVISQWREVEELVNIGAYNRGANPQFDLAIDMQPAVQKLLQQGHKENCSLADARRQLLQVQAEMVRRGQTSGRRQAVQAA